VLDSGDAAEAARLALASSDTAGELGMPIEAAISRALSGRAPMIAGDHDGAVAALRRAAAEFDACGARRGRGEAERELGRLGHRPYRRTRSGQPDRAGLAALTDREVEVARLIVDRKAPKNPLQLGATLWHFRHESRASSPPNWAQNLILPPLAALAKLFGVRPHHDRWDSRDTPSPERAT
jgi:hypothetical protein